MANTTAKRLRRAAKAAGLQGRLLTGTPRLSRRGPRPEYLNLPDEPEGGAGVREPRRPTPSTPGDGLALEVPHEPQQLDLSAYLR